MNSPLLPGAVDLRFNHAFRSSNVTGRPLRIGLMVDNHALESYAAKIVEDIASSDFAKLVCVIEHRRPVPSSVGGATAPSLVVGGLRALRDARRRSPLAFNVYRKLIDGKRQPDPNPFGFSLLDGVAVGLPYLAVTSISRGDAHDFPDEAIAWLAAQNLDVILRFGCDNLRGGILNSARHGVWSYHHGDSDKYRGGPPHLWELIERSPESGVVLRRLTSDHDVGILLRKAEFSTADSLAMSVNRFAPCWGSTHFVIQCLRLLYEQGWEYLEQSGPSPAPYRGERRSYRDPSTSEVVRWLVPSLLHAADSRIRRRFSRRQRVERWHLGIRVSPTPLYKQPDIDLANDILWLQNPALHYLADPFLFTHSGERWLFAEDFDEDMDRGAIVAGRIDSLGQVGELRPVLSAAYHLSYPHIFEHQGDVFMVPETRSAGEVQLWRARRFPDQWEKVATLLDLPCVDCTLEVRDGRWWMFASPSSVSGHAPETYLFTSDRLESGWRMHSLLPICSTVRRARSGGALVHDGDRLIRPSQDCAGRYGRALVFSEVAWGRQVYSEQPFATIAPPEGGSLIGVHSYARSGNIEVIDGLFVES